MDTTGTKRRWRLLPWSALAVVVDVMMAGAAKYEDDGWTTVPADDYFDAAMRHLTAYRGGERLDPETKLPHLAHFVADALILLALTMSHEEIEQAVQGTRSQAAQEALENLLARQAERRSRSGEESPRQAR